jgi:hypothetical protein
MAAGIQLPNIPYGAVPPTVAPDSMSAAAGLGFGGTASEERMKAYADRLVASGRYTPSEAAELAYLEEKNAWRDRAKAGPPQTNVDLNLEAAASPMPLDRETTAQRAARFEGYKADDARMAAFETNYNAETGHPEYGYDEAGNAARLGRVDINNRSAAEERAAGARRYQHRAPYNAEMEAANHGPGSDYAPDTDPEPYADMTVPGPRTLDGKSPTPSRGLTAEEAEAYNTRKPGQLSQRDRDMQARGYVPVVTPDGVSYQPAYVANRNKYAIPGGPGRPGPRTGLAKPYLDGKYEMDIAVGPDGVPRSVYAPTPEFRKKQEDNQKRRRQELSAERDKRRANWQATAMLAGGSQNLNSGNRWIAQSLVNMSDEDRANAMKYMLPGGQLHAQVDAANAEAAASMAQRAMTAFLANNPGATPMQQAALEQQRGKDRQDMLTWAERHISDNYAYDSGWMSSAFGLDEFTPEEQAAAVNDILQRYPGTTPEQARKVVDSIAARKGGRQAAAVPPAGATAPSAGGADGGFTG